MEQHSHQYKSVIDTLAEEEGLPHTAACTLFDADTDLWHTGNWEPLSRSGSVNQGHFVGFRCSKELHIYNCAWSQPPPSPRRQHHLVKIKLRTFPNSWSAPVLSFNNRMNGLRGCWRDQKALCQTWRDPSLTPLFPWIGFIQRWRTYFEEFPCIVHLTQMTLSPRYLKMTQMKLWGNVYNDFWQEKKKKVS